MSIIYKLSLEIQKFLQNVQLILVFMIFKQLLTGRYPHATRIISFVMENHLIKVYILVTCLHVT